MVDEGLAGADHGILRRAQSLRDLAIVVEIHLKRSAHVQPDRYILVDRTAMLVGVGNHTDGPSGHDAFARRDASRGEPA